MLVIALLIFGILTRFMPHASNFTPVIAIALFGGVYLNRKYAVLLPLSLMIISDLFIGLHDTILYTWGSVVLIGLLGCWLKSRKTPVNILFSSLASSFLFFIITNLGAWPTLYPVTPEGLIECFILAIPFFRTMLLSSLAYTTLLFGAYELMALWAKRTRFASVLLSN